MYWLKMVDMNIQETQHYLTEAELRNSKLKDQQAKDKKLDIPTFIQQVPKLLPIKKKK